MESGSIAQRHRWMKMTDDFDPAGIFPRTVAVTKFECFGAEGFDEIDGTPQFAIVIAGYGDRLAVFARIR